MAEVKWVKLTTDMFDNRKIKHLRRLPEGNNIVLIWVMLLTMAGRCNSGGMIFLTENIPYTPKMLADELGMEFDEEVNERLKGVSRMRSFEIILEVNNAMDRFNEEEKTALKALEQLDMIVTDNGFFSIAGWEEYQNIEGMDKIREQNRERKRLQRERQRQALLEESRDSHVTVTGCHGIEEEIEEDKEEEKEIHSFIRSYTDKKVSESGFEGEEAEAYREEVKEGLKLKYMGGTLGQGLLLISDEQFDDLCDRLSLEELHKYIGIIVECEKNGKSYKKKSHYQAILDMVEKDLRVG